MSEALLREIVERYVRVIEEIENRAAREEVVGDVIRSQVRRCLLEMQGVGAKSDDIRTVFDNLEHRSADDFNSLAPRDSRLLAAMKLHVEFLLFVEERRKLNSSAQTKIGDGFGFH